MAQDGDGVLDLLVGLCLFTGDGLLDFDANSLTVVGAKIAALLKSKTLELSSSSYLSLSLSTVCS